jgi:uncharacterized protein (PEP-CTERM system associated)
VGVSIISTIAVFGARPTLADTQFVPSVSLGTIYLDNLFLVPPGTHATSDWIGELIPRIQVSEQSPNLAAILDYSAQGLLFKDHSNLNAVHQNGAGNLTWNPLDVVYVDSRIAYTQQQIDLTQPSNTQNLFGVGNTTNEFDAMVAPYLKRDFGTMTGILRVQESISDFSGGGINNEAGVLQNSRSNIVAGSLASDHQDAPFYWHFDGQRARTTFETAEPFVTDRVGINVSEGVLPSLRITQSAGAETNILTHSTEGGLNAAFWSVGFKYAWSRQTSVEASAGHRFFGPSYSFLWTHESRLLKYHVTYSETATDASESTALTDFVPGQLQSDPRAYSGVLRSIDTFDPYVAKQLDAGFELALRRTQFLAHIYDLHRHYEALGSDVPIGTEPVSGLPIGPGAVSAGDSTRGAEASVVRDLGPRDQVRLNARADVDDEVQGQRFHDIWYEVEYTHLLARKFQLMFQAVRMTRTGSMDYRADILQLQLRKSF